MRTRSWILFASILVGGSAPFAQPIEIVGINPAGMQGYDILGRVAGPAIPGDGLSLAFDAPAFTLALGDTHLMTDAVAPHWNARSTEWASGSSGEARGNGASYTPAISADGRWVTFSSRPVRRGRPRS